MLKSSLKKENTNQF
jgi:hypothetical protein